MRKAATQNTRTDIVYAIIEARNDIGEVHIDDYPSVFLFSNGKLPKSHIEMIQTNTVEELAAEVKEMVSNIDWISTGEDGAEEEEIDL